MLSSAVQGNYTVSPFVFLNSHTRTKADHRPEAFDIVNKCLPKSFPLVPALTNDCTPFVFPKFVVFFPEDFFFSSGGLSLLYK